MDTKEIRVLILTSDEKVILSSSSKMKIMDKKTGKISYNGEGRKITVMPEKVSDPIIIESWKEPLAVDGARYRGTLEIHNVMGRLHIINKLKMDEYLYGVVPGEMPVSWPVEALKSQAIAARTYAYHHIMKNPGELFDLDATTKFQVYKGISVENEKSTLAVDQTSGEIGTYQSRPIVSYFHSTCGGKIADDKTVWNGVDLPYLKSFACPFCGTSPKFSWEERISIEEITRALRKTAGGIRSVKSISFKKDEGRVNSVVIYHNLGRMKLTGNQFRLLVSAERIKSLNFTTKKTRDGFILHGYGYGHGVGMCQYGAKGMAERGYGYRDILKFYYKNINISNIHESGRHAAREFPPAQAGKNI